MNASDLSLSERIVLLNLLSAGWKARFVDCEETAEAMKGIREKIKLSTEEITQFKKEHKD